MTTELPDLDHRFTAPIETGGTYATYVTVVGSKAVLGTGNPVKVVGTIDGHEFAATLMPSGQGDHWLPLRKEIVKRVGKGTAGDEVAVHLTERLS